MRDPDSPRPLPPPDQSPPPGFRLIPARTTYLEMLRDEVPDLPAPPPGWTVSRWHRPPLQEYRALFSAVGGEWGWAGRLLLGDEELRATLDDPATEIYRLRRGPRVAGFSELCRRPDGQVEIVYFGLSPEFIGRGLGGFLLRWTIHRAWQARGRGPRSANVATRRVWLHTCDHDHPSALAIYRRAGFHVYDERVEMSAYPEAFVERRSRELARSGRPPLSGSGAGRRPGRA
jgi:ribosomal protein S18 acetylase RimI-like enzyme